MLSFCREVLFKFGNKCIKMELLLHNPAYLSAVLALGDAPGHPVQSPGLAVADAAPVHHVGGPLAAHLSAKISDLSLWLSMV